MPVASLKELKESKMSELHASIGTHLDKHIAAYNKNGGAEALANKVEHAKIKVAREHNLPFEHASKFVNDYVDSKLSEGVVDTTKKVVKDVVSNVARTLLHPVKQANKELDDDGADKKFWLKDLKKESSFGLSFKMWNSLNEAASGADSDRDGKIHELLTGWHLNRHIHGKGAHMSHFRDEHGNSPEEAIHKLTAGMTEAEKEHHNNNAMKAAKAIHEHIKANHPDILNVNKEKGEHNRVTWTSQPNDIKNLTGKEDKAQQSGGADLMVTRHNAAGHVEKDTHAYGASLKYLSKKSSVTLSNRGPSSLEKQLGMRDGSLSQHDKEHDSRMEGLFGIKTSAGRHAAYKVIRDKKARIALKEKAKELSAAGKSLTAAHKKALSAPDEKLSKQEERIHRTVSESDTLRNQRQASEISDHLNGMSTEERTRHLTNLFGPEHTHPTYQIRTDHDSDKDSHIEKSSQVIGNALNGEHKVYSSGRYLKIAGKTGKNIGQIEFRSKGRPAGGASQGCPTLNSEANK